MAQELGGQVEPTGVSEFGRTEIRTEEGALFAGLPAEQISWMSHRDSVTAPPEGARVVAGSASTPIAAFEDPERGFYGVQFHPEVVHTPYGNDLLKNFLYRVADAPPLWTAAAVIEEETARIRSQVGSDRVLCALSGGCRLRRRRPPRPQGLWGTSSRASSSTTACSGRTKPSRSSKRSSVISTCRSSTSMQADRFLARLEGGTDPKRNASGSAKEFIRVFEDEARKLGDVRWLVQGTLYSDVIESGGGHAGAAETIKSHHNVGGLPEVMDLDLVEPLRMLFKDEVRRVGEELGLPEEMVWRHPFPGPGLAIRIIGDVTEERLQILRDADAILLEEVRRAGLYRELWQCFAVLPAIRSVGVQGDGRTYAYPIVIRAVTSEDAMTADWARLPYDLLETISSRIINEIPGVNRVALDVSSKPPATIEWE
jgi:GMP synthase (glutamine-hydrolysing)